MLAWYFQLKNHYTYFQFVIALAIENHVSQVKKTSDSYTNVFIVIENVSGYKSIYKQKWTCGVTSDVCLVLPTKNSYIHFEHVIGQ